MKSFILTLKYLRYFFTAQNSHDIHSPFVFNLVTKVLNKSEKKPVFKVIEQIRKNMLKNPAVIKIRDYGAGFAGQTYVERKINFIAAHSAKSRKYCMLLHRLTEYFSPFVMLEIGTSLGISAMYQGSAAPGAEFITMEGCENTAEIAHYNFEKAGLKNITIVTGDFEQTLPSTLQGLNTLDYVFIDGNHRKEPALKYFYACLQKSHHHTIIILDDINWSDEMMDAWEEIKLNPRVSVTVDLFMMGLVFLNPELAKQNFTIRF